MIEVLIALLAGTSAFLAAGAVTGQFSSTQRRVIARAISASAGRSAGPATSSRRVNLLREDRIGTGVLRSLLQRSTWAGKRAAFLEQADVSLKVSEYVVMVVVGFALLATMVALISGIVWIGLLVAAVGVIASEIVLRKRIKRRLRLFDQQFATALQTMGTSLRAGFGIMEAVGSVVREMEGPISQEFRRVLDEARVGGSFESGLKSMVERVDSADLRIVARALELHKRVGGNLAEILDAVASTIREREELRGHVLALTAQQRLGGMIVGLMPIWVVGFFAVVNPEFISPLWETSTGNVLLGLGLGLEVVAYFVMQRILSIEV